MPVVTVSVRVGVSSEDVVQTYEFCTYGEYREWVQVHGRHVQWIGVRGKYQR